MLLTTVSSKTTTKNISYVVKIRTLLDTLLWNDKKKNINNNSNNNKRIQKRDFIKSPV